MESRASDAFELAVHGPAFLDVVMGPLDGSPVPGCKAWVEGALMCAGGTANQVTALARPGMPVRLYSHVGVDQMGAFMDEMLAREGADTSSCERVGDQNVTVPLSLDGNRAMTTCGTTALPLLGDDALACLPANVRGTGTNSEVVSPWHARGIWALADTVWDKVGAWGEADLESLLLVDVCTSNEEEALVYARTESVEDAARWFASSECDYMITYGKNGMIACVDEQILRVSASAVNAMDTTGVGDVFLVALAWTRRARRTP